jgi:hypothetical protein
MDIVPSMHVLGIRLCALRRLGLMAPTWAFMVGNFAHGDVTLNPCAHIPQHNTHTPCTSTSTSDQHPGSKEDFRLVPSCSGNYEGPCEGARAFRGVFLGSE